MIRVVFYFENEWVFGAVHNELNKRLFKYGISSQILHWVRVIHAKRFKSWTNTLTFGLPILMELRMDY